MKPDPNQTRTGAATLDAARAWQVLSGRVEAFAAAWDAGGEPPEIGKFATDLDPEVRNLVLVELVKVDLANCRRVAGAERGLEEYLARFPDIAPGGRVPADLVIEEYRARCEAGERVDPREYLARFPAQAILFRQLFADELQSRSTILAGARAPDEIPAGERIDDFDLLARLGKGAFALVYLARQRSMGRRVALKVSRIRGDEPRTMAQLDHPNIVRVFDQRELPERGLRLLYMEYVPGGTLQGVVALASAAQAHERSGRLVLAAVDRALAERGEPAAPPAPARDWLTAASWPEAVAWLGARVAAALDSAHRRGVLHRDVKPANVLLDADGSPKLVDFNVSYDSKVEGTTPAAYFGGTLAYMSPEQLEAANLAESRQPEDLDGRSDVYSTGVLLWELLTGHRPFPAESIANGWHAALEAATRARRAGVDPALAALVPPGTPPGLAEAILACLEPEPSRRPATAGELARRLELVLVPGADRLFRPPPGSWERAVRRCPVAAILAVGVVPNALAGVFNYAYNRREIVEPLSGAGDVFLWVQAATNGIAFPAGLAVAAFLARPLARGISAARTTGPDDAAALRARALSLGHWIALLSVIEWAVAGVAYPVAMNAALGRIPVSVYAHFFASLILCGLVAAAYPFFLVTFLCVRAIYPALAGPGPAAVSDRAGLSRLARRARAYLGVAAAVPMLAVTVLVAAGTKSPWALGVLAGSGLAGMGLAAWLARVIHRAVEALSSAGGLEKPPGPRMMAPRPFPVKEEP